MANKETADIIIASAGGERGALGGGRAPMPAAGILRGLPLSTELQTPHSNSQDSANWRLRELGAPARQLPAPFSAWPALQQAPAEQWRRWPNRAIWTPGGTRRRAQVRGGGRPSGGRQLGRPPATGGACLHDSHFLSTVSSLLVLQCSDASLAMPWVWGRTGKNRRWRGTAGALVRMHDALAPLLLRHATICGCCPWVQVLRPGCAEEGVWVDRWLRGIQAGALS